MSMSMYMYGARVLDMYTMNFNSRGIGKEMSNLEAPPDMLDCHEAYIYIKAKASYC